MRAEKQRNYHFDNMKGILILCVVFGHTVSNLFSVWGNYLATKYLYYLIYTFHMPVFIFISGFFSKRHSDYETYLKKAISGCLIPYLIFNVLYALPFESNVLNIWKPNWIMWYLLSLFSWKILVEVLIKLKHPFLITLVFVPLIGMLPSAGEVLSLSRTVCFFPYFMAGYLMPQAQVDKIVHVRKWFSLPAACLIGAIALVYTKLDIRVDTLYLNTSYAELGQSYMLGMALRAGLLVTGFFGVFFFLSTAPKRQTMFSSIGMNSICVYLGHGFIIKALYDLEWIKIRDPYVFLVFALLFSLTLCFALGNKKVAQLYTYVFDKLSSFVMQ